MAMGKMKDLICVPDYNPQEINIISEIKEYINGICSKTTIKPNFFSKNRKNRYKLTKYLSKFYQEGSLCGQYQYKIPPLLYKIHNLYNIDLKRFIELKTERFDIVSENDRIMGKCDYEHHIIVDYMIIREPVINYLENKISKKELKIIKDLFIKTTINYTFDEYINKKTELLLKSDLDTWLKNLL